jgi:hypothetical protein
MRVGQRVRVDYRQHAQFGKCGTILQIWPNSKAQVKIEDGPEILIYLIHISLA